MNDIEKAMAFLREERRSRLESSPPIAAPVVEVDVESSVSDVERSVDVGSGVRSSNVERRDTGIGREMSACVAKSSAGVRSGVPSDIDRPNADIGSDAAAPTSSRERRPRFDDEFFADDVLDGIGTRRCASASSAPSSVSVKGNSAFAGAAVRSGVEAGADRAALDMPELGIVTTSSPSDDDLVPDLPESGSSSSDHEPASGAPEADAVFGPSPSDHESASDVAERSAATGASSDDREPSVDVSSPERRSGSLGGESRTCEHGDPENEPDRVVSLPLERLADRGFLTPGARKGRLSEEFRRVKRPILRNIADAAATDGHRNVVMVTSSVSGEGKTYTAINLAMSLAAERERTVLLVDADVLKGSAGTVLGIGRDRPGLVDVLDDERLDIADVMLATDVPDLRFVPAGRHDEQTTELLSSPRMSDLIDELARRYSDRIIVLDCPPMLQTNEANVIADHAGQVVFVVAGEETDQRLVLEAMSRFDEDKTVGVLLNKASGNSAAYGYDYGYG